MSDRDRPLPSEREISLVEILDRALGAGVVITGDVTISLADVELVYLNLRLLVASVGTIQDERPRHSGGEVLSLTTGGDGRP